MNLKPIKKEVLKQLSGDEIAYGEILFNDCECQILSQSSVAIDFLVNVADENESVEYSLLIAEGFGGTHIIDSISQQQTVRMGSLFICLLIAI